MLSRSYIVSLGFIFCASTVARCEDLKTLGDSLDSSAKALSNLVVESKYKSEDWSPEQSRWSSSGDLWQTATYDGIPGGKARVDNLKSITTWSGGTAPIYESHGITAFNGIQGQRLVTAEGPPGNLLVRAEGMIQRKRPLGIGLGAGSTGWGLSIFGILDSSAQYASSLLRTTPVGGSLAVSSEQLGKTRCTCLTRLYAGKLTRKYWFDPLRGYALLKFEEQIAGFTTAEESIDELQEVCKGVYFPAKAHMSTYDVRTKQPDTRSSWEAIKITANDKTLNQDVFNVDWPIGCVVTDAETKRHFIAGPNTASGKANLVPAKDR